MEELKHKSVTATYRMLDITDGAETLLEENPNEQPLHLITDLGMMPLMAFEQVLANTASGENYELTLNPEDAFGPYMSERVVEIDKMPFEGVLINEGMIVPLQNEQGERFMAQIKAIADDKVTIDLNHPYAGKTLRFTGKVIDNHLATNEEIMALLNQMNHHSCGGCSGGCSSCDGHCGHEHCGDDGNCHGSGGCGKCKDNE